MFSRGIEREHWPEMGYIGVPNECLLQLEKHQYKTSYTFCASYSRKTLTWRFNVFPPCRIGLKHGDLYEQSLETLKIAIG